MASRISAPLPSPWPSPLTPESHDLPYGADDLCAVRALLLLSATIPITLGFFPIAVRSSPPPPPDLQQKPLRRDPHPTNRVARVLPWAVIELEKRPALRIRRSIEAFVDVALRTEIEDGRRLRDGPRVLEREVRVSRDLVNGRGGGVGKRGDGLGRRERPGAGARGRWRA